MRGARVYSNGAAGAKPAAGNMAEEEAKTAEESAAPSKGDLRSTLKDTRGFAQMPQEMLDKLFDVMTVVRFDQGALIMEQGQSHPNTYIMLHGEASIVVDGHHIYDLKRTGDIFGEMSFVNPGPCTASVIATKSCDLIQISKETLEAIGDTHFYLWVCRVLADKLNRTTKLVSRSPGARDKG